MLGDADQLNTEYMLAEQDKIVNEQVLFGCENLTVRIRYRSRPIPCRVKRFGRRASVSTFSRNGFGHCSGTVCCVL